MKTRIGFVSNSSTSSFCILGVYINDEIRNMLRNLIIKNNKKDDIDNIEDWDDGDLCYALGLDYDQGGYDPDPDEGVVGYHVDGSTIDYIVEAHQKLVDIFGEGKYSIKTGAYYS